MVWNNNYCPMLPKVEPVLVGREKDKESARTQPIEMTCSSVGGAGSGDYIVKLWGSVELGAHSLAREVYGALLADFFNLLTPKIAVVDIDASFPQSQPQSTIRNRLTQSVGLNFGSKYIQAAPIFSPPLSPNKISEAAKVFCFDMLIGNVDRRVGKANVFHTNAGFILFDHEQAFPHSLPYTLLGTSKNSWEFIKESWARNHIFYLGLKGRDCQQEIEEFITDLTVLSDDIFAKIEEQIPPEWQTTDLSPLRTYLANTRDNAPLFKRSLQEILA